MWHIAILFLIALLSLGNGAAQLQQPQRAPQVQSKIKIQRSVENQQTPKQIESHLPPAPQSSPAAISDGVDSTKNNEQGTEFWSPFHGYHLKITDSLLVFFTLVLAIFTGLLWGSTHKLWEEAKIASATAEKSAKAALRTATHIEVTERAI